MGIGRPKKEFDIENVRKLAALQCTYAEIASYFGVHEQTVKNRVRDDPEFREAIEEGRGQGRVSLRREMWKRVTKGDTRMQIHLAKQYLGHRDRVEHSGDEKKPISVKQGGLTQEGADQLYEALGLPTSRERAEQVEQALKEDEGDDT